MFQKPGSNTFEFWHLIFEISLQGRVVENTPDEKDTVDLGAV